MSDTIDEGAIQATAAQILFDEGQFDALVLLLECEFNLLPGYSADCAFQLALTGPYLMVRDYLRREFDPTAKEQMIMEQIQRAVSLCLPHDCIVDNIYFVVKPATPDKNWREELMAAISGGDVHNQATSFKSEIEIKVWEGLRYRSQSEVKIAQALDRAGVMFFPNCRARVGASNNRLTREPDFLICYKGKWGILEVDGDAYHPPERAYQDHARNRLFLDHGHMLIDHFSATDCYNHPDQVVGGFLKHLIQS